MQRIGKPAGVVVPLGFEPIGQVHEGTRGGDPVTGGARHPLVGHPKRGSDLLWSPLAVVDDGEWAPKEIASALRVAHERMTGTSGDWIASAGSFVYLPDGLEPEWYDDAGRLADALHDAERAGDVERTQVLRNEVAGVVEAALPRGDEAFAQFRDRTESLSPKDDRSQPAEAPD